MIYKGAYNQDGEKLVNETNKISNDKCKLNDSLYEVSRHYSLGSGRCGGFTFFDVLISKNGSHFQQVRMVNDCDSFDGYVSSIKVIPEEKKIIIERKIGSPW